MPIASEKLLDFRSVFFFSLIKVFDKRSTLGLYRKNVPYPLIFNICSIINAKVRKYTDKRLSFQNFFLILQRLLS